MGADNRMYPVPWSSLPDFVPHNWVRYSGETSLQEMAESMCDSCLIKDGDNLIGSSLGGMVACEITKIRKIRRLYLIGSAAQKEEVSRLLTFLHPLVKVAPIELVRLSAGKVPLELAQMFADAESAFVRTMCAAIFKWDGLGRTTTQVLRLHGRHDMVIPPPKSVDLLVDGGHLIAMSHARECVQFIATQERMRVRS
ncbi:hypothetical protein [Geomonas oryzae]|uniref:hypothetical protein n=1 Tax=Geomonas oryzae TaxID=2364273 RepID=UPI0038B26C35